MTHADVLTQILSEATGKPLPLVRDLLAEFRKHVPLAPRLDQALPDAEAQELIRAIRGELPQIRELLAAGRDRALFYLGL